MRKTILILCSILLANQLFAEKVIEYNDVSFYVQNYVTEYAGKVHNTNEDIIYTISSFPIADYLDRETSQLSDTMIALLNEETTIVMDDILDKFELGEKYVLHKYFGMDGTIDETYRYLKLDDTIIGEMYANGSNEGGIFKGSFDYYLRLVYNDEVYTISLKTGVDALKIKDDLTPFAELLYDRGDYWFFTTPQAHYIFDKYILNSNIQIPQRFLELNVTLRWLLDTLKINNQSIEVVSPDKAFITDIQGRVGNEYIEVPDSYPYTNLVVGTINDERLRVRTEPRSGETLGHVNTNDRVIILGRTGAVETIDNLTSYWYNIKFGQQEGWIFGGYVDVEQRDKDLIAAVR